MQDRVGLLALDDAGRERAEDGGSHTAGFGPANDVRDQLDRLDAQVGGLCGFLWRETLGKGLADEDLGALRLCDRREEVAITCKAEERLLLTTRGGRDP